MLSEMLCNKNRNIQLNLRNTYTENIKINRMMIKINIYSDKSIIYLKEAAHKCGRNRNLLGIFSVTKRICHSIFVRLNPSLFLIICLFILTEFH